MQRYAVGLQLGILFAPAIVSSKPHHWMTHNRWAERFYSIVVTKIQDNRQVDMILNHEVQN